MLGEVIINTLVLILGYAYPAFECFKTIKKQSVQISELRFWCQYWVIIAIFTVLERIGDIFISWVPMYGEMKLALFICLWYPKPKGSGYIYEALLKPFVMEHETYIERSLKQLRGKAWDLAIYYWQNCTELGQTKFFEIFQCLANKPSKVTNQRSQVVEHRSSSSAPPPPPVTPTSFFPSPPPPPLQYQGGRQSEPVVGRAAAARGVHGDQDPIARDEEIQKLVAMGFERTQVEVALAAADGDLNVAVEILMSQQV